MQQLFPNILFRNSLWFYQFILLSLPIILQLFPDKGHMSDHVFPSLLLAHARSRKYGLVSRFFSTVPRETHNKESIMAPVRRLEEAGCVFTRNSVGARPHISLIIPSLCRILTPAYYLCPHNRRSPTLYVDTPVRHTGIVLECPRNCGTRDTQTHGMWKFNNRE